MRKSLLVLDEAHTAAPASASQYAVDSQLTVMIREELADKFDNRLFLSATPHNGHSNSFSALMAMLDPQRFTRGVPIQAGSKALSTVMVRRLKRDLVALGKSDFPERKVIRVVLEGTEHPEVVLSRLLAEYSQLMKPGRSRGRLVFVNLQKRLLSSIDAFSRTLEAHASHFEGAQTAIGKAGSRLAPASHDDDDAYGVDEEQLDLDEAEEVALISKSIKTPEARGRELLDEMLALARRSSGRTDAKTSAMLDWIKKNLLDGKRWNERRVIVFTEYGDSMRLLERQLNQALEETHLGDERVAIYHGGMGDESRDELQAAFNGEPKTNPVRILVATDAAREGLNLQNYCADLFHFDVPWNPARMEQRNGRIDRTLQPSPEVRCHYFVYPERAEDVVLERLVTKVETIQQELGSLGEVVMVRLEKALGQGIGTQTLSALDEAEELPTEAATTKEELESQRADLKLLRRDIDDARKSLENSRKLIDFREELLRDAIDVGLELAGVAPMKRLEQTVEGIEAFELPPLPPSWERTLDSLRRPKRRDEQDWEWRKTAPQPVVFRPLDRMGETRVHLHLQHPFVQRILGRFLAQGFGAQDLSRATLIPDDRSGEPRVLAFGRLSLFGPGAARLHDESITVGAPWRESGEGDHLKPWGDDEDRHVLTHLEELLAHTHQLRKPPKALEKRLAKTAASDFSTLWRFITEEADSHAHSAGQLLTARGEKEAKDLRDILLAQRVEIEKQLGKQLDLFPQFEPDNRKAQREQLEGEREEMKKRLGRIAQELESEPEDLRGLYRVTLKRLVPLGLVYLWPTTSL